MADHLFLLNVRLAYVASQLPRFAWNAGHEMVLRRLAAEARRRSGKAARPQPNAQRLHQSGIYGDMLVLLQQDLANVETGIYPLPHDRDGSLLTRLHRSRLSFDDLPEIHRRPARNGYREVLNDKIRDLRPDYYLQNFHYQSGGWMTDESAERYDTPGMPGVTLGGAPASIFSSPMPRVFRCQTTVSKRSPASSCSTSYHPGCAGSSSRNARGY
jgi:hypothetical protein